MSTQLIDKLDNLDQGLDYTDPETYRRMLYDEGQADDSQAAPAAEAQEQPEQTDQTTEGETAPAAEPAAESSEAPAAAEEPKQDSAPAGVATRDGKHVIPYTVLEQERQQRRDAEKRAAEMQAELQRLKEAGSTSQQQSDAIEAMFSPEELEELAEDAPAIKKLHDAYTALAAKLKAEEAAKEAERAARQQATEDESRDVVAAQVAQAIAPLPLLSKWRDAGGGLWQDAVALDKKLAEAKPDMGMAERFAEVQNRIASQYGIPIPSAAPAPSPTPKPKAPSQAPVREVLPSLTDFNGGPAVAGKDPLQGLSPGQMVDKVMDMDMEQIRRMAGLSY